MKLTRLQRIRIESIRHQDRTLRKQTIRIQNPLADGVRMLKLDRAYQHVASGRADWGADGNSIVFRSDRVEIAARQAQYDRAIHARMATAIQMRGIPIVQAERMLILRTRRALCP